MTLDIAWSSKLMIVVSLRSLFPFDVPIIVLEGKGVKVGLITTEGFRQILHIDRSFVPGGLAAFIVWNKGPLLAPLESTVEVRERIDADGAIITPLEEKHLMQQIKVLKREKVRPCHRDMQ